MQACKAKNVSKVIRYCFLAFVMQIQKALLADNAFVRQNSGSSDPLFQKKYTSI